MILKVIEMWKIATLDIFQVLFRIFHSSTNLALMAGENVVG